MICTNAAAAPAGNTIAGSVLRQRPGVEFVTALKTELAAAATVRIFAGPLNDDHVDDVLLFSRRSGTNLVLLSDSTGKLQQVPIEECNHCAAVLLKRPAPGCRRLMLYDRKKGRLLRGSCTLQGCALEPVAELEALSATIRRVDLNGDGIDDVTIFDGINARWHAFVGERDCSYRHLALDDEPMDRPKYLHAADLGDNGKEELLVAQPNAVTLFSIGLEEPNRLVLRPLGTVSSYLIYAGVFAGEFLRPGRTDLLTWSPSDGALRYLELKPVGEPKYVIAAQLPDVGRWREPIVGDFTGDGLRDLLLAPKDGRYWWLISAAVDAMALEVELPEGHTEFTVGDFDGDGRDDLVSADERGELWLGFARESWGVPGALVYLSTGANTKADRSGRFRFENVAEGEYTVNALHPQYDRFEARQVRLAAVEGAAEVRLQGYAEQRNPLAAIDRAEEGPGICAGFPPSNSIYWGRTYFQCPPGQAVYEVDDQSGNNAMNVVRATCCPLPHGDILTDTHMITDGKTCPDGFVATGGSTGTARSRLRCTKINAARYELGPVAQAMYWGLGFSIPRTEKRINKNSIPAAIRHAVGRNSRTTWDHDGCIGDPPGALFAGQTGGQCRFNQFRQLRYRGKAGDPPAGTPVTMFRECAAVASIFAPPPRCLP